ncbi:hypothetical protein MKK55_08680 [Methylobacterium sp. J-059]|uniref:hypothetical protein n=1 Tax=Methylobacterium sp. J-059 TaxID=2836643 RepID=UPI001FB92A29|nr:hypothetical protein [Methylobacterium sp. J-059]MCJ2039028.1 hypothetical protein [Methylobacterium sp. J-059]
MDNHADGKGCVTAIRHGAVLREGMRMTPDHVRTANAILRLQATLKPQVELVEEIEAVLAGIEADARPAKGVAALAAATAERDKMQARLDRLYRATMVIPELPHEWLHGVLKARIKRDSLLGWLAKIGSLGGPRTGSLLIRVRDLGRDGAAPMGPDCPVVIAMMLEDEARAKRGAA